MGCPSNIGSIILLTQPRSPLRFTAYTRGRVGVLRDKRQLSDKIRSLSFEYVHTAHSYGSSPEYSSSVFRDKPLKPETHNCMGQDTTLYHLVDPESFRRFLGHNNTKVLCVRNFNVHFCPKNPRKSDGGRDAEGRSEVPKKVYTKS